VAGWGFSASRPRFLVYQCFRLPVVSSLWTPDGERPVGRPDQSGGAPPDGGPHAPAGSPGGPVAGAPLPTDDADDTDEEALAEQVAAMRAELAKSPVEVVVANHCYGLFELAAVYLSQLPPLLDQARLAIDALGAILGGLEGRLGEAEEQLKDGLSQLRLAYVQIDGAQRAGAQAASGAGANGGSAGDATEGSSTPGGARPAGDTPTDGDG
jgi:hypothetical protein